MSRFGASHRAKTPTRLTPFTCAAESAKPRGVSLYQPGVTRTTDTARPDCERGPSLAAIGPTFFTPIR